MDSFGVTVKELLNIPLLKDVKVISGEKGIDRIVRYIDIMEVPDFEGWLREGELLLTTAYSIRNNPLQLPKLIEHMAKAGAAALGIKPHRFIQGIPEETVFESNKYGLPIIEIPQSIPYIDITQAVMELVLNKQAILLRRSEEIYKSLTKLVLENTGLQHVADKVADLLSTSIQVTDRYGNALVKSPQDFCFGQDHKKQSFAILVDKQVEGNFIIDKEHLDDMEQVCVEQARLVFSLELMRKKTELVTELRLRGNFVDELLSDFPPSMHEIENKGKKFGFSPNYFWEVAIIEINEELGSNKPDVLTDLYQLVEQNSNYPDVRSYIEKKGDRILLILPSKKTPDHRKMNLYENQVEKWGDILKKWADRFQGTAKKIRVGIGQQTSLWEIQRGYSEARKALSIGGKLFNEQHVMLYEDIEVYQLLYEVKDNTGFEKLLEKHLGKLYTYDKEHGTDLVKTLHVYLECSGSLVETASKLFIHRNSVKYRMDRIKEIADVDLDNARECFLYQLCLAYYYLKEDRSF